MRFADITGQEDLKRHLTQSVDAGRVSHAQLFTGTAGSGALAVAVAYDCLLYTSPRPRDA